MTSRPILVRGGTLVTDERSARADLLVEGERIARVGPSLEAPGDAEVVDATGRLVLPGGVDPHTHFDLEMFDTRSSDDHYTGHEAAAFGGTTTVLDFVPQLPLGTLADGIARWREKAARAAIDFGFHANVTRLDAMVEAEIPRLLDLGIPTLKVFTAYNGRLRLSDRDIFRVLRLAARHGMLVMMHAENGDVIEVLTAEAVAAGRTEPVWHARTRPAWGAVEATFRGAALAAQAGCPLYVVHMNVADEVEMISLARRRGARVMGETCPQYLFFEEGDLARPDGAKFVCSPPFRAAADREGLWKGLEDGRLHVVATDHCPFFFDGRRPIDYEGRPVAIPGKELGARDFTRIPNGVPGVGDRLPVLWTHGVRTGRLTPERFVALTSANPARIFGLWPRKGSLAPGADADLVIWDPERRVSHGVATSRQRTDYNLYEGWELVGWPEKVFLRGRLLVDGERWLGTPGGGRFLERGPNAPVI